MYITELERIDFILKEARKQGLAKEDVLKIYVDDWLASPAYHLMLKGQGYYNNENEINRRKRTAIGPSGELIEDKKLQNSKLSHAFIKKLVDQKKQYVLGKPLSIKCDHTEYGELLNGLFDKNLLKILQNICKESVNKGIAWLQVYFDETGQLHFKKIPSEQIIPLWMDDDHEELSGVIRVYSVETYEGRTKKMVRKLEYWSLEGVEYYTEYNGRFLIDVERESGPHFTLTANGQQRGMRFTQVPFIWFKYNEEELPLIRFVKALVDDYDLLKSDDSNNIIDSPNATLILKGYDGENLGEFRHNLATYKVIKVANNETDKGDVVPLSVPINTGEVQIHLAQNRKDIYEIGRGVDTQTENLGTASGVALKFVYADLDLDCNGIEAEFQNSFRRMLFFINTHLQLTGRGDYSAEKVEFILNRDIIINETEAINNCKASMGVISEETIVANHPFVTNLDKELATLREERTEQLPRDDYGQMPTEQVRTDGE